MRGAMERTDDYVVIAENVWKSYRTGGMTVPAVRGVSIRVRKGEFVAINGPSGSGKTTLLNCLGLLTRPDAGRIILFGIDSTGLSERERAEMRLRRIGFVFQFYNLFPEFTVLENVILPMRLRGDVDQRRAEDLLDMLGILPLKDRYPQEISGGEQQRVAIARALSNGPSLILADEPTGNLDWENSLRIVKLLRDLTTEMNVSVVMVTHERSLAEMANRVIFLLDGKVVGEEAGGTEGSSN